MKAEKRIIANILSIVLGACLLGLSCWGTLDAFWSGMGGALISIGIIRTIHILRYSRDEAYREEKQIEAKDERNQFRRNKAWAWAAYIFVLITAAATFAFKLLGQDLLSMVAGFAICILFVLYWLCYMVLKKKY